MTDSGPAESTVTPNVFQWAADKQAPLTVTLLAEGQWCNLRSQVIRFDPGPQLLQILYPVFAEIDTPPEISPGVELGLSFRRGHKKCVFVSSVVTRQRQPGPDGQPMDTLVVRIPQKVRELQRRAYQRVMIPPERMIAVKLWQGGVPMGGADCWPLCAGRLSNVSMGGLLADIRREHNPRLAVGDMVGVELTPWPGKPSLFVEAQYRHCTMTHSERLGLGLQFLGLERELPGRTSMTQFSEFVAGLRQELSRQAHNPFH